VASDQYKSKDLSNFLGGNNMARLILEAMSEDTIASPGNRQSNYIVASVTDGNGLPVTGLGATNFKVDPMIVGAGGALVNITLTLSRSKRKPGSKAFISLRSWSRKHRTKDRP
jgi:hypothetical protein